MELKQVIGNRRSMRFLRNYAPVEREKIQKMLEAARLASHWGNVQALRAVVIERASAPEEVIKALPVGTAIAGFQFRSAPVVIVWYIDWTALPKQGDRLHELVDAGAMGVNREKTHKYLDETLIPFFDGAMDQIKVSGINELDAGQAIAQATLVAFDEGLGTCCLGLPSDRKLRRALKLPPDTKIVLLQTVGYPAEDARAGGQRPRIPFDEAFKLNTADNPFPRDPAVVEELRAAGMIQAAGRLPYRDAELRWLQEQYGLSEVFGDPEEIGNIMTEMMEAMQEEQAAAEQKQAANK
ncbi:MAG: nitroreductase family protein [Deltaproteobacteria bacterium]|nr:nitroreductase family protein [Deltaproteobacteria bacterium]